MNGHRVVHFCSGGGTTMRDVAKRANQGSLGDIESVAVIASKPDIKAIKKAKELGIPVEILDNARDPEQILRILSKYNATVASLNGWIPRLPEEVITEFLSTGGILLNQHPGPLRANGLDFGGAGKLGMYGSRVTAARVLYLLSIGAEGTNVFTESSVQHVAPEVDRGVVVGVKRVNFADELNKFTDGSEINLDNINFSDHKNQITKAIMDFVDVIQKILLPEEHRNVADVFFRLGHGGGPLLQAEEFPTVLIPEANRDVLIKAKERAVLLYPKG